MTTIDKFRDKIKSIIIHLRKVENYYIQTGHLPPGCEDRRCLLSSYIPLGIEQTKALIGKSPERGGRLGEQSEGGLSPEVQAMMAKARTQRKPQRKTRKT